MFKNNNHTSGIITFVIIAMLSACGTSPKINIEKLVSDAAIEPDYRTDNIPDKVSVKHFIRNANETRGEASKQYFLRAAELLYSQEDFLSNRNIQEQTDTSQSPSHRKIYIHLLAARIALASNIPSQALDLLPDRHNLSTAQLFEANTIRVKALTRMGRHIDVIRTLIENEQLTRADDIKEQINKSIWETLSSLPTANINDIDGASPTLNGWIELALLMRNSQTGITLLQDDILDWGTQFPLHPTSNTFIDNLLTDYLSTYSEYKNIAVFLPTDGKHKAIAAVVINGILSAYYEDNLKSEKPTIRFYDTSDANQDFDSLFEQAIADGTDVIIGPLDKTIINKLAENKSFDIPILSLNYAEDNQNTADNLYQFGLLPEDEAQLVAELAIQQNKVRAAILTPDSKWGERLASAFQTHFEMLGGEVLSQQQYATTADDFSNPIRSLLNIDHSNSRHKRLQRLLKTDLKFTPQRRQDIDMIFIAATHRAARGIIPGLKFHHAGDIQTYATSHVYTGHLDTASDRDLNGLIFCDIPWTLVSKNKLKKTFNDNWEKQNKYTRLYALGVDAYSLINNLRYLKKYHYAYFSGETGNILIDDKNRLHRKLVWAKFVRGRAVYINPSNKPVNNSTYVGNNS